MKWYHSPKCANLFKTYRTIDCLRESQKYLQHTKQKRTDHFHTADTINELTQVLHVKENKEKQKILPVAMLPYPSTH